MRGVISRETSKTTGPRIPWEVKIKSPLARMFFAFGTLFIFSFPPHLHPAQHNLQDLLQNHLTESSQNSQTP